MSELPGEDSAGRPGAPAEELTGERGACGLNALIVCSGGPEMKSSKAPTDKVSWLPGCLVASLICVHVCRVMQPCANPVDELPGKRPTPDCMRTDCVD